MQREVSRGESSHDLFHSGFVLSAAHGPHAYERLGFDVDPGLVVEVGAALVVRGRPALQHRYERKVGGEFA
jgi:hypothetical protein